MNQATVRIGDQFVGEGHPVFIIAEIGINHNGSLDLAKRLIDGAVLAGADAVKFQKRTPGDVRAARPVEHRARDALGPDELHRLPPQARVRRGRVRGHRPALPRAGHPLVRVSCWDEEAVDFMEQFDPPCLQGGLGVAHRPRAAAEDEGTGRPLIISRPGCPPGARSRAAVAAVGTRPAAHRPLRVDLSLPGATQLNLKMIHTLKARWPECPIGYSGHETGLPPTWAAVAMGATLRRAAHHAGPRDVGQRPGRLGRGRRLRAAGHRTSATSSSRWATASSGSTTASWRQKKKLRRVQSAPAGIGPSSLS